MCSNIYPTSPNPYCNMKTILKIARAELRSLFYSPVAWLVIILYFIVCGLRFTGATENMFRVQSMMLEADPNWYGFNVSGLTAELTGRVLDTLVSGFYLFIPLLTMGVINREVNSGTMKLLYSSPIRTRDIVLGKYLGLLVMVFVLVAFVSLFLVSASLIVKDPEVLTHVASLLGVFLVVNAYIAVGVFISCVTNYLIVAGVLTYVVFFILESIGGLWQQYDLFRDLTYFLSISGRANNLLSGLISTRDLFYFILIILLFLGFSLIRLKSMQESRSWRVSFARYAGLFIIVIFLGYVSARPGQVVYWDLSRDKLNTISPNMQAVLKELDGSPLTITLYTNLLTGPVAIPGLPQNRNAYIWRFWEPLRRFYPNMQFKFVYYYDVRDSDSAALFKAYPKKNIHQIADMAAKQMGIRKSLFLPPAVIRQQIDLGDEKARLVMQVEYKGQKEWLRAYGDGIAWPGPQNVAGTLKKLATGSAPKLLYTSGHYERGPYASGSGNYVGHILYANGRYSLINVGVDADTIALATQNIPPTTAALIVADPRSPLAPAEQDKVKSFLQQGGNALILAEVNKQPMLNTILNTIGVHIDKGTIVHPGEHEMPHMLRAYFTHVGEQLSEEETFYEHRQLRQKKGMLQNIEGGANISYRDTAGFKVEPIIELPGNEKTWIENGVLVVDSAAPVFSAAEGDVRNEKYVLGVKLTRTIHNKEQRILVIGDADVLGPRSGLRNHLYSWILNNKYPVYSNPPKPTDVYFTARKGTIGMMRILYIYVIPALLLVCAIVLLVRRKRK